MLTIISEHLWTILHGISCVGGHGHGAPVWAGPRYWEVFPPSTSGQYHGFLPYLSGTWVQHGERMGKNTWTPSVSNFLLSSLFSSETWRLATSIKVYGHWTVTTTSTKPERTWIPMTSASWVPMVTFQPWIAIGRSYKKCWTCQKRFIITTLSWLITTLHFIEISM